MTNQFKSSGSTVTGKYKLNGDKLTVYNSGYDEKFSLSLIAQSIKQGWMLTPNMIAEMEQEEVTSEEMMEHAWKLSQQDDEITIETPDIMFVIPAKLINSI